MKRTTTLTALSVFFAALFAGACTSETGESEDEGSEAYSASDDEGAESQDLTSAEIAKQKCDAVPVGRPLSAAEQEKLLQLVLAKAAELKSNNDARIREFGVGTRAGVRTSIMLMRNEGRLRMEDPMPNPMPSQAERFQKAADLLVTSMRKRNRTLKMDPVKAVEGLSATSCIGFTYEVLRYAYGELGRGEDFKKIEGCARARGSVGLYFQQALIKNGWAGPTLGFASDTKTAPAGEEEAKIHNGFLSAAKNGTYFGTPISKGAFLGNFLPIPGSPSRVDDSLMLQIGKSKFFGVGTFRAGYHVPLMVGASLVPDTFIQTDAQRAAKARGEIFIIESHSRREAWDSTNFEIRPMKEAVAETYKDSIVYSTGNILFAPGTTYAVPR